MDDVQSDAADAVTLEAIHTTNWTWSNVQVGQPTMKPIPDQQYLANLARCEERVRHVLASRYQSTLQYKSQEEAVMTATTAAMIRTHGVDTMFQTFKKCTPERTQEIIGRTPLTIADLLEIQPPTPDQYTHHGNYLTLSIPAQSSPPSGFGTADVGLYVGSATGMYGVKGRWSNYETYKNRASEGIRNSNMKGTHLDFALQPDYTMHLRAWIYFSPQHHSNSKQQCLLWEGFGMDLFNSLHLEDQIFGRYRTPEVLMEAAKAIPPELAFPPWKGLNDAHALKQGVGPPNEYCYMRANGCSTEEASGVAQPGIFDDVTGNPIYLCIPCAQQFYEYRTEWSCNEDGRRCSRPSHKHKVLSTAKREDCFEAWTLDIVQKWAKQGEINAFRLELYVKQNWLCPCGRALHSPDTNTGDSNTFRGTLIPFAPEPTLGCDACYTDWSLRRPENATIAQFEAWKHARAAWRASVNSKPQHEACVCSTDEEPVLADRNVVKYKYNNLEKTCRTCYPMVDRVIKTWEIDMDNVQENARALRIFIGLRGALDVQLERYPDAPNCSCAGKDEHMPALVEWVAKDRFPLEEPKLVCNLCRRKWIQIPARFKTEDRARSMFEQS